VNGAECHEESMLLLTLWSSKGEVGRLPGRGKRKEEEAPITFNCETLLRVVISKHKFSQRLMGGIEKTKPAFLLLSLTYLVYNLRILRSF
jgi:hypothetical protein